MRDDVRQIRAEVADIGRVLAAHVAVEDLSTRRDSNRAPWLSAIAAAVAVVVSVVALLAR